jgi:hypothetical protein
MQRRVSSLSPSEHGVEAPLIRPTACRYWAGHIPIQKRRCRQIHYKIGTINLENTVLRAITFTTIVAESHNALYRGHLQQFHPPIYIYTGSSTYDLCDLRLSALRPQKFNFFCDPILFAICTSKIIFLLLLIEPD